MDRRSIIRMLTVVSGGTTVSGGVQGGQQLQPVPLPPAKKPKPSWAVRLQELTRAPGWEGYFTAQQVQQFITENDLETDALLFALLPMAADHAIAPLSGFHVGAVAQGASGGLYLGANMELAGLPLSMTMHAEQAAVAHAWAHGEEAITQLAVTAAPCGFCRQFLYELASAESLQVRLPGRPATTLRQLLPAAFGPRDLGVQGALLSRTVRRLQLEGNAAGDALAQAALAEAACSYAPYTGNYAGLALQVGSGRLFKGRLAENAAYNPSLSPLHMALSALRMARLSPLEVSRAVLVEAHARPAGPAQASGAMAIMEQLGGAGKLTVLQARLVA